MDLGATGTPRVSNRNYPEVEGSLRCAVDQEECEMVKREMAELLADWKLARTFNNYRLTRGQRIAAYMRMKKVDLEALMERSGLA